MKRVNIFIATITLLSGIVLCYTVWKLPPENTQGSIMYLNLILFGVSLTIFITGIFTFLWYLARKVFFKTDSPRMILRASLREGLFAALFLDGFLLLQKIEAVTVINLLLLGLLFFSLELYIGIRNREKGIQSENKEKIHV